MGEEIRLELVMEKLELPMEACFRLSQAKTLEAQARELMELKGLVLNQKAKLMQKYRPSGVPIIGGGQQRIQEIHQLVNFIMTLRLPENPKIQGRSRIERRTGTSGRLL